jgi:hypothetical protein
MLDTGYATSAIDADLVERLRLRRRATMRIGDYATQRIGRLPVYRLAALRLGDARFTDVGAVAVDGSWNGAGCLEPFAGILGSNVLARGRVEIDSKTRSVHLAIGDARLPDRPGGIELPFTAGHMYPNVQVPFRDAEATFLFDTGNDTAIDILPSLSSRLSPSVSARCTSRTSASGTFGPRTDTPQPCRAFPWPADAPLPQLAGVTAREANVNMLGAGLLPYFTARVDYPAGTVTLWRNDREIDTSLETTGLELVCDASGNLFVGALWHGTAAEAAGIREGNRVARIVANGQVVESPCGCGTACGCGWPRAAIGRARSLEVSIVDRARPVTLERVDLWASPPRPDMR